MCSVGQISFNTVDGEVMMKVIPFQELVASNPEPRNWRANIISVLGTRLIWSHCHAMHRLYTFSGLNYWSNQILLTK